MIDVLIVEDLESSAEALARLLALWGYTVARTITLEGARRALSHVTPRHCFVDVQLPDGDGRTLVAEIKAAHPQCRVFLWTARLDALWEYEEGNSPADNVLMKPPSGGIDSIRGMLDPPLAGEVPS